MESHYKSNLQVNCSIALPSFFNLELIMGSNQSPALEAFWRESERGCYARTYRVSSRFYKVEVSSRGGELGLLVFPEVGKVLCKHDLSRLLEYIVYQFDLETDYDQILTDLHAWPSIKGLFEGNPGLRTMRNFDFFEGAITSILSQNTSIGHLNKMLTNLSARFGEAVRFVDGTTETLFPLPDRLIGATLGDFDGCGLGYRARYIGEFCKYYANSWGITPKQDEAFAGHNSVEDLKRLPGIGPKVEAMILSFALARTDVFVVDVWVKRGLKQLLGWDGTTQGLRHRAEMAFSRNSAHVNTYVYYALRSGLVDVS